MFYLTIALGFILYRMFYVKRPSTDTCTDSESEDERDEDQLIRDATELMVDAESDSDDECCTRKDFREESTQTAEWLGLTDAEKLTRLDTDLDEYMAERVRARSSTKDRIHQAPHTD